MTDNELVEAMARGMAADDYGDHEHEGRKSAEMPENIAGYIPLATAALAAIRKTHAVVPRDQAHRERQKEIMRLMREDFDPTPPNWEGREWHDNAEDVADKIEALLRAESAKASLREAVEVMRSARDSGDLSEVDAFLAKLEKTNADPA